MPRKENSQFEFSLSLYLAATFFGGLGTEVDGTGSIVVVDGRTKGEKSLELLSSLRIEVWRVDSSSSSVEFSGVVDLLRITSLTHLIKSRTTGSATWDLYSFCLPLFRKSLSPENKLSKTKTNHYTELRIITTITGKKWTQVHIIELKIITKVEHRVVAHLTRAQWGSQRRASIRRLSVTHSWPDCRGIGVQNTGSGRQNKKRWERWGEMWRNEWRLCLPLTRTATGGCLSFHSRFVLCAQSCAASIVRTLSAGAIEWMIFKQPHYCCAATTSISTNVVTSKHTSRSKQTFSSRTQFLTSRQSSCLIVSLPLTTLYLWNTFPGFPDTSNHVASDHWQAQNEFFKHPPNSEKTKYLRGNSLFCPLQKTEGEWKLRASPPSMATWCWSKVSCRRG